jgi:hypothetical protein
MHAIPHVRAALAKAGQATGAAETGVTGLAATSYDTGAISDHDLMVIVPVVLIVLALLLAMVLRSLVAPLYLIVSVGLSYLAALGLVVAVFMGIGHGAGVILYLPFLMFVFLMALGSDYNILIVSRIREEARERSLPEAVARAIGATGGDRNLRRDHPGRHLLRSHPRRRRPGEPGRGGHRRRDPAGHLPGPHALHPLDCRPTPAMELVANTARDRAGRGTEDRMTCWP